MADVFIIGSAAAFFAVFLTLARNAWYASYYNDDGSPKETKNEVH